MIVRTKDALRLAGISVIAFCAVFVCTLFLNFNLDMAGVKALVLSGEAMAFYDAQALMGNVISSVSGGCLLLTSVVMLLFYIKHYIDAHKKELGILKALGYSNWKIAKGFWIFGLSVLTGTASGFAGSHLLMPVFYDAMNGGGILPDITPHFHILLAVCLAILPAVFFGVLAVLYGCYKMKCPPLDLIRERTEASKRRRRKKSRAPEASHFLRELRRSTVRSRPALVFFIAFSSFCYASMMQMSVSITKDELAGPMFTAIVFGIGILLSFVTLLLAVTTVVSANAKSISLMKVFGYSYQECRGAVLNGYRPAAYLGFAVGTAYQYMLIKVMVGFFASTEKAVPETSFNFMGFAAVLVSFVLVYEAVMGLYATKIRRISVKGIMLE